MTIRTQFEIGQEVVFLRNDFIQKGEVKMITCDVAQEHPTAPLNHYSLIREDGDIEPRVPEYKIGKDINELFAKLRKQFT